MSEYITTGKIYIGKDGAGRLYIRKKIMDLLNFEHGSDVFIKYDQTNGVLYVAKDPRLLENVSISDEQKVFAEINKIKKDVEELKEIVGRIQRAMKQI